jgi:hypothetical protein
MLSSEFTVVLTKSVQIPASGVGNASVYLLVLNSNPDETRVVDFFIEVGSVRSASRSISVATEGSKLTIIPVELPPGDYTLTVYAKADKEDCVSLASVSASVR